MKKSLISVTFRQKSVEEIAEIAQKGGLEAIEWGGDRHVKPGDKDAIALANKVCAEKGLSVSAYGSYYRCNNSDDFAPVLETALALNTKIIRVWAGGGFAHSSQCSPEYRAEVTENLRKAVAMAEKAGLSKKDAEKALVAFIDTVTAELQSGEKVQIVGFGGFEVRKRPARMARNPRTGEQIKIAASKAPVFKAGKALKESVNK